VTDRRIREPAEMFTLLGVPLFASIPGIRPDARRFQMPRAVESRAEPSAI
jgi:hypothetical protein